MKALLITALGEAAGKTGLAVALGRRWQQQGRSVAYLRLNDGGPHPDATFAGRILGLPGDGAATASLQDARRAAAALGAPDVLLVEHGGSLDDPAAMEEASTTLEALDARALLVARYHQRLSAEAVQEKAEALGARLAGIVLNGVPARRAGLVQERLVAPLQAASMPVRAVLPETRALYGFTVGELADHLHARLLCLSEQREGLIENLMVGANPPDPALSYFAPMSNKAVFCRTDRPDIQLAALDTTTRCLVLAGGGPLQTSLVNRAEDEGVPVLQVTDGVIETVSRLDGLVERVRFHQAAKLPVMQALLEQHLDFQGLEQALD